VSLAKAWKEMGHRYLAAMLGLVIVLLAAWSWVLRQAPLGLAALAVQIALGGWVSANYAALACPGRLDHDPDFCGLAPLRRGDRRSCLSSSSRSASPTSRSACRLRSLRRITPARRCSSPRSSC